MRKFYLFHSIPKKFSNLIIAQDANESAPNLKLSTIFMRSLFFCSDSEVETLSVAEKSEGIERELEGFFGG